MNREVQAVESVHCCPPCPVHLCIEWSKVGMCGVVKCPMETTCTNERTCLASGELLEGERSE